MENIAREGIDRYPDLREMWYYWARSLYLQEKWRDLVYVLQQIQNMNSFSDEETLAIHEEISIYALVAAYETGDYVSFSIHLSSFLLNTRLGRNLNRVLQYVTYRKAYTVCSPFTRLVYTARYGAQGNDWAASRAAYQNLSRTWPERLATRAIAEEIPRVFTGTTRVSGLALLDRVVSLSGGDGAAWSAFAGMRIANTAGDMNFLVSFYTRAVSATRDPAILDQCHLLRVQAVMNRSYAEGIPVLRRFAPLVSDSAVYDSMIDSLITDLLQYKWWALIQRLRDETSHFLSPAARQQIGFAYAQLVRYRYIKSADSFESVMNGIISEDPFSYYGLAASAELGQGIMLPDVNLPVDTEQISWTGRLVAGLMDYGLIDDAYATALPRTDIAPDTVKRLGLILQTRNDYLRSLRLLIRLYRRDDVVPVLEDLYFLYPKAYWREITEQSTAYGIPSYVMFGLAREESLFTPDIGSIAGAQGIAQLMPGTAKELAAKLKMRSFDLKNPETNLKLGSFLLSTTWKSLGNLHQALMAYNAGPGRIKSWRVINAGLPNYLFAEAVPILETRWYGRKVLASAMIYGMLYYQKSLGEVLHLVIPGS